MPAVKIIPIEIMKLLMEAILGIANTEMSTILTHKPIFLFKFSFCSYYHTHTTKKDGLEITFDYVELMKIAK